MGTISSGVGLISGINHKDLIDQLMAIESRPKTIIEKHNATLQAQQVAFQAINAKLLGLKSTMSDLATLNTFRATTATSSDESVLTVKTTTSTTPGSYRFTVDRLVSSQQTITSGFADTNTTPLAASTLSFETTAARLDRQTNLDELTMVGEDGFVRGSIRVTDRSGSSAVIDLSKAITVDDVLTAISNASGVKVTARVAGDKLEIVDDSGGAGSLSVAEENGGATAASLGLAGSVAGATLTGSQINSLTDSYLLTRLNDGNGIRLNKVIGQGDFKISQRDGVTSFNVDLRSATTINDVINAINNATGNTSVTAALGADGVSLRLTDASVGADTFRVEEIGNSKAATDLGIATSDGDADGVIGGARVIAAINSKLLKNLNGGLGAGVLGSMQITNRAGASTAVDLSAAQSMYDIVNTINNAGAGITASLNRNGNGLLLTDTSGGTGDLTIADQGASTVAATLNIAGTFSASQVDSDNLQFRYISESTRLDALNGGRGVSRGKLAITTSSGSKQTLTIASGSTITVGDVLNQINSRFAGSITARINDTGDGILLEDIGPGTVAITVEESGSTAAADLGLLGSATTPGADLDGSFERKITIDAVTTMTGATLLSSLNKGSGVRNVTGKVDFRITTADGSTHDVDLDGLTTVQEVIDAIHTASGNKVAVTINSQGTGLNLQDTTTGQGLFKVEAQNNAKTATDLGILTSDSNEDGYLLGTNVVGAVTLDELVTKINDLGAGVRATIINDGSSGRPYRLSLTATNSGLAGAFIFDDGGLGMKATNISQGRNAVVFYGDPAQGGLAITSTTNKLEGTIPGATLELKSASADPVEVVVNRDDELVTSSITSFVDKFNDLIKSINQYDSYNTETQEKGLLLGDSTLSSIKNQLFRMVSSRNTEVTSQFTTLFQVGVKVTNGDTLVLDQARLTAALTKDRSAVEKYFSLKEIETDDDGNQVRDSDGNLVISVGGMAVRMTEALNRFSARSLQSRLDGIDKQVENNKDHIADLEELLAAKRTRLETQFNNMETALSQLQNQSSSLASLASLASSSYSSGSSNG
ncbi:MAG: flagellar filament capping protein FliD [Phycisphaeraceae bacterium]|nr:flagellar filament capping protein FliD [Phycisphaeraceae bacterium]